MVLKRGGLTCTALYGFEPLCLREYLVKAVISRFFSTYINKRASKMHLKAWLSEGRADKTKCWGLYGLGSKKNEESCTARHLNLQ